MGKRLYTISPADQFQWDLDVAAIVTIEEVKRITQKSEWWVRARVDRGDFVSRKAGKNVLISLMSVTAYCWAKKIAYTLDRPFQPVVHSLK